MTSSTCPLDAAICNGNRPEAELAVFTVIFRFAINFNARSASPDNKALVNSSIGDVWSFDADVADKEDADDAKIGISLELLVTFGAD